LKLSTTYSKPEQINFTKTIVLLIFPPENWTFNKRSIARDCYFPKLNFKL
jgi:hypothetical protein